MIESYLKQNIHLCYFFKPFLVPRSVKMHKICIYVYVIHAKIPKGTCKKYLVGMCFMVCTVQPTKYHKLSKYSQQSFFNKYRRNNNKKSQKPI